MAAIRSPRKSMAGDLPGCKSHRKSMALRYRLLLFSSTIAKNKNLCGTSRSTLVTCPTRSMNAPAVGPPVPALLTMLFLFVIR
ncbi:hypothetical protein EVAR_102149_1 [Eumeta japonica]|uniref:Uncharacterized protein n=1 Tax=Eumeta variegata TaxID=151549 RepID=A0A4C1U038_EUMVA|nr:hypothetical protein EVAR_102149_1 [Eumeta japonica]